MALENLYFFFIHSYLNYENIVSAGPIRVKLKKLASKQKQALRIVNKQYADVREIMVRMKVLNVNKPCTY